MAPMVILFTLAPHVGDRPHGQVMPGDWSGVDGGYGNASMSELRRGHPGFLHAAVVGYWDCLRINKLYNPLSIE